MLSKEARTGLLVLVLFVVAAFGAGFFYQRGVCQEQLRSYSVSRNVQAVADTSLGHPCYAQGQDCITWLQQDKDQWCSWRGKMAATGAWYREKLHYTRADLDGIPLQFYGAREMNLHERTVIITLLRRGYDSGKAPEQAGASEEAACLIERQQ